MRFERGRYVISGLAEAAQASLVEALALNAERVGEPAGAPRQPRLGLFLANTSMDEGWTRWVLEQYEFQFTRVSGADIQAGSLRDRIDVLVVTDEPQGVLQGGGGPRRPWRRRWRRCRSSARRTTRGLPRSRRSSATAARSSASTAAPPLRSAVSSCR